MKPLLAILILSFAALIARAQNDKESMDFIRSVFHEKNIIYTDSIGGFALEEMKKAFNEQLDSSRYGDYANTWVGILHLTVSEKQYISNQIDLLKYAGWKSGLIENAKLIPSNTLNEIFHPTHGKKNIDGWGYFYQHYGKSFHTFSNPIFIRNHSICLFYADYSCGHLCGGGSFDVYIKQNGVWVKMYTILNWIS